MCTHKLELPSKSQQWPGSECKSGKSAELSTHLVYLLRLGCLSLSSRIRFHSENKCMFLMSCTDFILGTTPFLSRRVCVLESVCAQIQRPDLFIKLISYVIACIKRFCWCFSRYRGINLVQIKMCSIPSKLNWYAH